MTRHQRFACCRGKSSIRSWRCRKHRFFAGIIEVALPDRHRRGPAWRALRRHDQYDIRRLLALAFGVIIGYSTVAALAGGSRPGDRGVGLSWRAPIS
jgi:hypothetical protein